MDMREHANIKEEKSFQQREDKKNKTDWKYSSTLVKSRGEKKSQHSKSFFYFCTENCVLRRAQVTVMD
jgi:hypothetical protein